MISKAIPIKKPRGTCVGVTLSPIVNHPFPDMDDLELGPTSHKSDSPLSLIALGSSYDESLCSSFSRSSIVSDMFSSPTPSTSSSPFKLLPPYMTGLPLSPVKVRISSKTSPLPPHHASSPLPPRHASSPLPPHHASSPLPPHHEEKQ